jgi:hypothetical protein
MCAGDPLASSHHHHFHDVASGFEELARVIEHALEALAVDTAGGIDIESLMRAKRAAERGAALALSALK